MINKEYEHDNLSYLFLCVVAQAVKDAFLTKVSESKKPKAQRGQGAGYYDLVNARYWLTEDKKDFYDVCAAAKVSADRIRQKSKELLAMPYDERKAEVRRLMREMYGKKVKKYL